MINGEDLRLSMKSDKKKEGVKFVRMRTLRISLEKDLICIRS